MTQHGYVCNPINEAAEVSQLTFSMYFYNLNEPFMLPTFSDTNMSSYYWQK